MAGVEVGVAPVVGDQGIARVEREGGTVVGEGAVVLGALGVHISPVEVGGGQILGRTFAKPYVRRAAAKLTIRVANLVAVLRRARMCQAGPKQQRCTCRH